jgi:hypothetical protein
MQKKIARTVEEVINLCDSCGKEIDKSEIVSRCCMCYKDICQDCKSIISINSWTFFICPECKKSLTIQQLEDRLNEKNQEDRIRERNYNL